jgi:ATP-dependent helicase/nuclease subunit B
MSKTEEIINILRAKALSGFSPTALIQYIKCKLQFYFSVIAGIKEPDEVEETVDAATLGTVVHQVLEDFFKPFLNKNITIPDIKRMIQSVEINTKKAFKNIDKNGDTDHGKNHLILKVAIKFLHNFLLSEMIHVEKLENQKQQLIIQCIEEPFESEIRIGLKEAFNIRIKGKVDRIDLSGQTIRIIDYKTGSMNAIKLEVKDWEDIILDSKLDKCFQLLSYAWLYINNNPHEKEPIQSGIIGFRKISAGFQEVSVPEKKKDLNQEVIKPFEEKLKQLLTEIFNPEIPFIQTEDEKNCIYCVYKNICNR